MPASLCHFRPPLVPTFHIYCDESCHLHDGQGAMVLGSIQCPARHRRAVARELRKLKDVHGLSPGFEPKWTKVSPARFDYYSALVDLFWNDRDLSFRAIVIPDKSKLRHDDFQQTHDDFYYKLYFYLLRHWLDRRHEYRVFLDIKDTRSWDKTHRLHEMLSNSQYDFDYKIVRSIELVRSDQVPLVQLTDLLTGCVSYANRGLASSTAKSRLVELVRERSGLSLTRSTLPTETKLNIYVSQAREKAG
ncbi:MAG: DUF3800 domain-containing protein [Polyangiaceae bacterium]